MNYAASKIRLILKLRQEGIINTEVLSAIEKLSREDFIPKPYHTQAYENIALPIGLGQTISQPYVVAFMTQALEINSRNLKVLEVGTGSGFQAAVLAQLVSRVYSLERHRDLAQRARNTFDMLKIHNITSKVGDGYAGWQEQAPFDRIITTCAIAEEPETLLEQLTINGIMVLPKNDENGDQNLVKIHKTATEIKEKVLLPVRFVPMLKGISRVQD